MKVLSNKTAAQLLDLLRRFRPQGSDTVSESGGRHDHGSLVVYKLSEWLLPGVHETAKASQCYFDDATASWVALPAEVVVHDAAGAGIIGPPGTFGVGCLLGDAVQPLTGSPTVRVRLASALVSGEASAAVLDPSGAPAQFTVTIKDPLGVFIGAQAGCEGYATWHADSHAYELVELRCYPQSDSSISDSGPPSQSSSLSESSAPSQSSTSSESSAPSESSASSGSSAPSESSASSQSQPPSESWSGSDKSTAIVPASWSPTGYVALFIHEMPEVRFDDVMTIHVPQADHEVAIDPHFVEVCEKGTIEVCGIAADKPISVGARAVGDKIRLRFAEQDAAHAVRLVIRLTGIRRGFAGKRFPRRTHEQFLANEAFINSAYPSDPKAE